jgi:nitrogen fixation NifU-like protein
MSSEFEKALDEIQKAMWEGYSETVIEHANRPRNVGRIQDADGCGSSAGSCGDTMQIWLKVKNDLITDARFLTDGCGATVATGSMVTELAKGKSITAAHRIGRHEVLEALGGLPEGNVHCADLAADTLKAAIKDYLAYRKEPWKRAYRSQP